MKNISRKIILKLLALNAAQKSLYLNTGVNLAGYIHAEMGLGHGCRLLAQALEISGIPWAAIDYGQLNTARNQDSTWSHKVSANIKYNVNIIHINPDNLFRAAINLPKNIWRAPYNIAFFLWELTEVPDKWAEWFEFFDEIWTPSNFSAEAFRKKTKKPVIKIPYGISVEHNAHIQYNRAHFKLPEDTFLFLTMYDFNSTAARKNPKGAVDAFIKAFAPPANNVGLVVKISNAPAQGAKELVLFKESLAEYKNVFFFENTLSKAEVNSLLYCVDCFVSLHRSEGFGLVLAEAMYLKKPVIGTNWSANVDFMHEHNSCPVNYTFATIEEDHGPYRAGLYWAEPDINHAAFYMKKLCEDKQYYNEIAENGWQTIKNNFSHEACATNIKNRLTELNLLLAELNLLK